MTRLNKYLAERLGLSRREADSAITQGKVTVNGKVARLGQPVLDGDSVEYLGQPVTTTPTYTYLIFNKPVGYVCSRKRQGNIPTLYQLLPKPYQKLKTVGRLDKDSSGLILLTNDGDFAFQMTHPKFAKTKQYLVSLDHPLSPLHQQLISDFGINLKDGPSRLGLTRLDDTRQAWRVTMAEGRNRQIRRTFGALGYTVTSLHRTAFGNYHLGQLKPGDYRQLDLP